MATATSSTTAARTDLEIQQEGMNELKWEPRVLPHEIGVAVEVGVVNPVTIAA